MTRSTSLSPRPGMDSETFVLRAEVPGPATVPEPAPEPTPDPVPDPVPGPERVPEPTPDGPAAPDSPFPDQT
jgi:hypothetical protein